MAENDNKKTDFQACSIEYTLLKIHEITLKKKQKRKKVNGSCYFLVKNRVAIF